MVKIDLASRQSLLRGVIHRDLPTMSESAVKLVVDLLRERTLGSREMFIQPHQRPPPGTCHERLLKRFLKEAALRERELLTMDAAQRYLALTLRCPTIEDVVPLRDIASYLGISAVHLSRVRGGE